MFWAGTTESDSSTGTTCVAELSDFLYEYNSQQSLKMLDWVVEQQGIMI